MTDRAVFEFGDITVDLARMAAARDGAAIPLEPKAFDVLVYLIEHRDRLVTKDELLEAVWTGTFVTPNVLTRAVAQIRKALGENPEDARYIETVAKRGYRFVAPVASAAPAGGAPVPSVPVPAGVPSEPRARRRVFVGAAAALLVLAAVAAAILVRQSRRAASPPAGDLHLTRLTNRRGFSGTPALSLDGRALVYSSDATGALELYLASLTPGVAEVQLTRDGGHNMQPAWSPDGQWIAYHSRKRGGVWIVPPTGGTPQQVTDFGSDPAWSPDSRALVFTSDAGGLAGQSNLWTVGRDGSGRKPLTQIGTPAGGHRAPAWSHDGRLVAFVVTRGGWTMQIWTVNVATGEQHLIETTSNGADPVFAPDDGALIWGGSTSTGNGRVFRRAIDAEGRAAGETETLIPFDGGIVEGLGVASNGTLVFAGRTLDANLWAVDVDANGRGGAPVRLTDDIARSTHPDYSADGRIAYQQVAIGSPPTVWIINEDGSGKTTFVAGLDAVDPQWDSTHGRMMIIHHPPERAPEMTWVDLVSRRLTASGFPMSDVLSPRLSPDGKTIAFHVIEKSGRMTVSTSTLDGKRTVVAADADAVSYPVWSRDGAWLAVEMKRGDSTQIGVVPSTGGNVVQLTDAKGQNWPHSWAPDNDRIVFAGERDGVWNVFTVSRTTRAVTQLTSFGSPSGYVRYPTWSPRGSRVVFERSQDSANVWTASLPSSQLPQ